VCIWMCGGSVSLESELFFVSMYVYVKERDSVCVRELVCDCVIVCLCV
jgi:hypothetical protein